MKTVAWLLCAVLLSPCAVGQEISRPYAPPPVVGGEARPFTAALERPFPIASLALTPLFNGSFEMASMGYFAGWGTYSTGIGGWYSQTGTTPPSGFSCSGTTVQAPTDGSRAAMAVASNSGMRILYQDLAYSTGPQIISFDLYLRNFASNFYSPPTLDPASSPNQQFRADILSPVVAIGDNSGVLRNLYATRPGDPLESGYTRITRPWFGFLYQDTRIRFAETDTEHCLYVGVDNVKMFSVRPGDLDGDVKADVFWHNDATGQNVVWLMNGTSILSALPTTTVSDVNYRVAGIGDLDANGTADVVWRREGTGQLVVWLMNGATVTRSAPVATVDPAWRLDAVADVDGDAKADLIWRKVSTGEVAVWLMDGTSMRKAGIVGAADPVWQIVGTGDLTSDGQADIIWRNTATGANAMWMMYGLSMSPLTLNAIADPHWKIAGVADFTLDGKADLLWYNDATGQVVIWAMSYGGTDWAGTAGTVPDLNWHIEAVGDFNGDGIADIFWRNIATGQTVVWRMSGSWIVSTASLATLSDLHWRAAGAH